MSDSPSKGDADAAKKSPAKKPAKPEGAGAAKPAAKGAAKPAAKGAAKPGATKPDAGKAGAAKRPKPAAGAAGSKPVVAKGEGKPKVAKKGAKGKPATKDGASKYGKAGGAKSAKKPKPAKALKKKKVADKKPAVAEKKKPRKLDADGKPIKTVKRKRPQAKITLANKKLKAKYMTKVAKAAAVGLPAPKKPKMARRLPPVPESLRKRRRVRDEAKARALRSAYIRQRVRDLKKKIIFHRAESYIREYREKERLDAHRHLRAKSKGNFYVKDEPKVGFVIRIRGVNGVSPRVRKVLQLLRLRQINNGVFIKINKATVNMLRIAEPYLTWGFPNLKSVRELIYKRGYGKVKKSRIPLTSNAIIEKIVGYKNIICMEDLIHELYTGGDAFKQASNFLWPFKLNNPTGGWRKKTIHYVEGGDFGCRDEKINELLRKMV